MTESNDVKNELSLGEILRLKREELKMQIAEVSRNLRVKESDIEAIENNHIRRITSHIYAPGLIRSYAKFLRINDRIIEDHLKLLQFRSNVENREHVLVNLEEDDHLSPTKEIYFNALVVGVFLLLLLFGIYNFCIDKSDLLTNKDLISQLNSVFSNDKE